MSVTKPAIEPTCTIDLTDSCAHYMSHDRSPGLRNDYVSWLSVRISTGRSCKQDSHMGKEDKIPTIVYNFPRSKIDYCNHPRRVTVVGILSHFPNETPNPCGNVRFSPCAAQSDEYCHWPNLINAQRA